MENKLKMVNAFGQYLAASRTKNQIVDMALMISQHVMGFDHAIIRFLSDDLLITSGHIGFPSDAAKIVIRVGEGISGEVAKSGKTILVKDTLKDPRFLKGVEGCRSELCVPLMYNNKTIGVFNVESENPVFFTEQDEHILETLASQVAQAMETNRLRDQLRKSEKLSMVGQIASTILHDIRNDIHQLYISSDLLARPGLTQEKIGKVSEIVRGAGENIYGMIEDIFEFVKTGETRLEKKSTHLQPALESIAVRTKSFAPNNVKIQVIADPDIKIDLDEKKFRRILLNLTRNSIEAMPKGGHLTISAAKKGSDTEIEVKDTGIGIKKENLSRIWDPLFTSGKQTGTGLGMAIVKKIVEDHGWEVAVRSKVGKGTTFIITARQDK